MTDRGVCSGGVDITQMHFETDGKDKGQRVW